MTVVEALASGKPVIALGRGGAAETVPEFGGVLFDEATEDALADAVERFELVEGSIRPAELRRYAQRFSQGEFLRKTGAVFDRILSPRVPISSTLQRAHIIPE